MIHSSTEISSEHVARHYDELDVLYRKVWGEHVHHGFFVSGRESKEEATRLLSEKVASLSEIKLGESVCDVGCGYGGTSRILASEYGAKVLGVTISPSQLAIAKQTSNFENPSFRLMNWLSNELASESFDHLISIESSEHMPDKQRFFSEAHRVLKPRGTFVICAWLTTEKPKAWEVQHLLEPICREGRMPGMGSEIEYRNFFADNGFTVQSFTDISKQVKRTWTLTLLGLAKHLLSHPKDIKYLLQRYTNNAEFLKTLFRIRIAYETGAMRYGIFKAVKN